MYVEFSHKQYQMNLKKNGKTYDTQFLRMYRTMFKEEYGEVGLKNTWRKDIYPQYKQNRKKGRDNDSKDWDKIFGLLNAIKSEFKEILPYKYVEVYGAESR